MVLLDAMELVLLIYLNNIKLANCALYIKLYIKCVLIYKVLTDILQRTYCYSGLGSVGELYVLGEGKTQLVLKELGQRVVEIILICRDANCRRTCGTIGHMPMNITSDLKFLNIRYPFTNERISIYLDKHSRMPLDTKDYFVKQISHLSKGLVIVALA